MPTYDTTTGLRALEGTNPVSDIDAGFLALAQDTAALVGQFLAVVTTLPSSPVDGQRCLFLADATDGVVWDLRYRAASASPYKWELVGGSNLHEQVDAFESTFSASAVDLLTVGPSLTLPRAGEYDFTMSAVQGNGSSGTGGSVWLAINGAVGNADAMDRKSATANSQEAVTLTRPVRKVIATPGAVVKLQYSTASGQANFGQRVLQARPVRVS